jgi:hypothetical protein
MKSSLNCCLTEKPLSQNDNIVCFPMFLDEPTSAKEQVERYLTDPVFQEIYNCNEGCALRSAFNTWELRDIILTKARESWVSLAQGPREVARIGVVTDDYLIYLIHAGNLLRAQLFGHILSLDYPKSAWSDFCKCKWEIGDTVTLTWGNRIASFTRLDDTVEIHQSWKWEDSPYERVELTLEKWIPFYRDLCECIREER